MLPISVFIITKNEADRVGRAIASVRSFADEIIVIDSGSTDDTLKVAQSLGVRVIHHDWPGYGLQKRFGEDQCKNRWLLNIDADEEITPQLAEEIRRLFSPLPTPLPQAGEGSAAGAGEGNFVEPEVAGFILHIRDLLPGETKLALFAHTNYALRLYNREKARFSDHSVHDTVRLLVPPPQAGEGIKILKSPVLHRSFRCLSHALEKMNAYTTMQAEHLQKKGMMFPALRLVTEFPLAFLKDYILRGYILRGRRGFINAVMYGFTRFVRIAKYMELLEDRRN